MYILSIYKRQPFGDWVLCSLYWASVQCRLSSLSGSIVSRCSYALLTARAVWALRDAVWSNRCVPQTKGFFWHILTSRLVVHARMLCVPLMTPQRQKRQPFGDWVLCSLYWASVQCRLSSLSGSIVSRCNYALFTARAVWALCDAVWSNRYVPQTKGFFWHILTSRLVVHARTLCAPLMTPQRQKRQPFGDGVYI